MNSLVQATRGHYRRPRASANRAGPITRSGLSWMHTIARFPVTFRHEADGAPFKVAALFVVLYIVTPQFVWDPVGINLKYLLAASLMGCFAWLGATRPINLSPSFLLAPLLLTVFGGLSLAYATFFSPGTTTYSSALIPLIIAAMPLLIANSAARTDGVRVARYLIAVSCVAAVCHVLWQGTAVSLGWEDDTTYYGFLQTPGHEGTLLIVNLMVLAGLFRRNGLLALSILLMGLSLVLRPTSTLVFAAVFAAGFITLHRLRLRKFLRLGCIVLALAVAAQNLAVLESKSFADAIYSIEPLVKNQTLDAQDNNEFRLNVLAAARDEMAQHSLLVGKAFVGDVAIDPLVHLPWVHDVTMLTIHSDFAIMIVQGGLIGYALFVTLFVGMAWLCSKGARLATRRGDHCSATVFDALLAMNGVFMLYISANPILQDPKRALPYLILLPLAVFLARQEPGFLWGRMAGALRQPRRAHALAGVRGRGSP